ncbi:MAG: DUF4248 domain-containing protein [Bacteroidaceae bacterium]|nr:DUF4248 domain-containing protein [Bacteroidaceae bacterium]
METPFRHRAYGTSELAVMYYPFCSPSWARRCFNRELLACRTLSLALRRQGWHIGQKVYTPRQVRTIVRFLGEP